MDDEDRKLELYKLEYSTAANRYQEIYRSMWTIFSYLTAISAAIFAFSSDKIDPLLRIATSMVPLMFWYWTTYLPLDRYGNNVVIRLGKLESDLNETHKLGMDHYHELAKDR